MGCSEEELVGAEGLVNSNGLKAPSLFIFLKNSKSVNERHTHASMKSIHYILHLSSSVSKGTWKLRLKF
jgi:hypothetical protein